jgi:hypothetical protein
MLMKECLRGVSLDKLWVLGLMVWVWGAPTPLLEAADLKGANSKLERPAKVGEKQSSDSDGTSDHGLVPTSRQPALPLVDQVDPNFSGKRTPGVLTSPLRWKPTSIANQYRVVEDPSGKFKEGDIVIYDSFKDEYQLVPQH